LIRVLVAALILAATQAQALRCLPPDIARSYMRGAAEGAVIVRGALHHSGGKPTSRAAQHPRRQAARLSGMRLGPGGFDQPFDGPVTIQTTCAGPWCGAVPQPSDDMIYVLRQVGTTWVIAPSPCDAAVFAPTGDAPATLTACLTGRHCG